MGRFNLTSEYAFYGRELKSIGHLYLRTSDLPCSNPDLLHFLYLTTTFLTDKKLTLSQAGFIQKHLEFSFEDWMRIWNWEQERPFTSPARIVEYAGYAKSCFSSSMMFRDKEAVFRLGKMGFGIFSNKQLFDYAAGAAVFATLETSYNINSTGVKGKEDFSREEEDETKFRRKLNKDGKKIIDQMILGAAILHRIRLGQDLSLGNKDLISNLIYQRVTGDDYPFVKETDRAKWGVSVDRAYGEYLSALEKREAKKGENNDNN